MPPERKRAIRRASFFALWLIAMILSARAVVGERGLLDAHRSRRELAGLKAEVEKWRGRNTFLESWIKSLRDDPTTIEAIARERLDWIRPGEITFLFPQDPAALEPGDPGPVAPGEFSATLEDEPGDASAEGSATAGGSPAGEAAGGAPEAAPAPGTKPPAPASGAKPKGPS